MSQSLTERDPSLTSGNSPPSVSPPEEKKHKHSAVAEGFKNRTWGESVFNLISYFVVGFIGVTAASIGLTYLIKHTQAGSRYFNSARDGLIKHVPFIHSSDSAKRFEFFDQNLTIATLFTGGTLVSVLPIKWLEDCKAGFVKWLDKLHYGADHIATDLHFAQAHREMEEIPQQTWKSVGASRLSSFIATYGTSFIIGPSINKFSIRAGRCIDAFSNYNNSSVWNQISHARQTSPHASIPKERMASIVWGYIVLDAIYTAITAASLFSFTRIFAPLLGKEAPVEATASVTLAEKEVPVTPKSAPEPASAAPKHKIGHAVRDGNLAATAQTMQMQ